MAQSENYKFAARVADDVARDAVRALLYEVSVTPKPGLVDRENNGAHSDMNIFSFLDSSVALYPYFRDIFLRGCTFLGDAREMLPDLRFAGKQAEARMLASTGGVNTHKGAVFSLGIICAAAGYLRARGKPLTVENLLRTSSLIARDVPGELDRVGMLRQRTHGETVYWNCGLTGVRGEAAAGFPHVRRYGLPVLRRFIQEGASLNDAGVAALLHLIAHVPDTNIVSRSNRQTLRDIHARLRAYLAENHTMPELLQYAARLDRQFTAQNISPGGCADLLAVTYLLFFLREEITASA